MKTYDVQGPDGRIHSFQGPDDATPDEVQNAAASYFANAPASTPSAPSTPTPQPTAPAPQAAPLPNIPHTGYSPQNIARQLGLGTRATLEGVGDVLDFLNTPFRAAGNAILPQNMQARPGIMERLSNTIGLPSPENPTERIASSAARLGSGALVPAGVAGEMSNVARNAPAVVNQVGALQAASAPQSLGSMVARTAAASPALQAASGMGAGAAGQGAKELGFGPLGQFGASLAGGIATPWALGKVGAIPGALSSAAESVGNKIFGMQNAADQRLTNVLGQGGMDYNALPFNIKSSLRNDVEEALKTSGNLSDDALRRLVDYRMTGTTPTRATLTLDPAEVTQQKDLLSMAARSKDKAAQQLSNTANQNNSKLIENLNDLGASNAQAPDSANQTLKDILTNYAQPRQDAISNLYATARDSSGRAAPLDHYQFTQDAGDALRQSNLEGFLPGEIRTALNKFADQTTPLNVDTAEQFKTIIGNSQRASDNGNVRMALSKVREALDNAPLVGGNRQFGGNQVMAPGQTQTGVNLGQDAINAYNQARAANRQFMQTREANPALDAAVNDADSKGFFQKYVHGSSPEQFNNLLGLLQQQPGAVQSVKNQVLGDFKNSALNGANEEVGNFSQSAYNKALNAFGPQKLNMLFNPDELTQLRSVGRVASYEQARPTGSAVNTSNTGGMMLGNLANTVAGSSLLSKIPFGKSLQEPAQNIATGILSKRAMDVPSALGTPPYVQPQTAEKGTMPILPLLLEMNRRNQQNQ